MLVYPFTMDYCLDNTADDGPNPVPASLVTSVLAAYPSTITYGAVPTGMPPNLSAMAFLKTFLTARPLPVSSPRRTPPPIKSTALYGPKNL